MNFELHPNKCERPNPGIGELKRRETHAEPPPSIQRKRFKNMLADVLDRIDENAKALVPDDILLEAEDGALVAAAKSGSTGAFEVLVKRHQGRILRIAQRVTRNREDAEDVLQQSFQKVRRAIVVFNLVDSDCDQRSHHVHEKPSGQNGMHRRVDS
jgi:hypothetical protein